MAVPQWMYTTPIAHRGLFDKDSPENSMGAFEKAMNKNYAIEMDVRLLKDKTLVVFHDKDLKRMTGLDKLLSEVTYEEVSQLTLLESQETIPRLESFLNKIDGKVPLMIEFKNDGWHTETEALAYEILKNYKGPYVIQSFNPKSIHWFKKHAPQVIRGQLSCEYKDASLSFWMKWILKNTYTNIWTKPHYVIYDIHALENKVIKRLRKKGMPLFSYTAKTKKAYDYALSLQIPACFEGFLVE